VAARLYSRTIAVDMKPLGMSMMGLVFAHSFVQPFCLGNRARGYVLLRQSLFFMCAALRCAD
jgi:hypothetical protein